MDIEIPANTTATIFIPAKNASSITESGKAISTTGLKVKNASNGYISFESGSGSYHFEVPE
jgi:alpha-L-rhamnosidase